MDDDDEASAKGAGSFLCVAEVANSARLVADDDDTTALALSPGRTCEGVDIVGPAVLGIEDDASAATIGAVTGVGSGEATVAMSAPRGESDSDGSSR